MAIFVFKKTLKSIYNGNLYPLIRQAVLSNSHGILYSVLAIAIQGKGFAWQTEVKRSIRNQD
jgi:hypothetical protein